MLALTSFALVAMKLVVLTEARVEGLSGLGFFRWIGFAAAWLGMNPRLFAEAVSRPLPGAGALLRRGLGFLVLGLCVLFAARCVWEATRSVWLATVLSLPGISFCIHFGLCNVLASAWRGLGVDCQPLFRAPLRAEALAEFWSKRWNLAFSEMTASAVYRPLGKRFGRTAALVAAFAVSGLLHELAISVPVRAGFGLPLLYFLLHGVLVAVERALAARGRALGGFTGRAWVIAWLVAPLPLLLHRPFLSGVIWPLLGISGTT
jgi:alginate O-acetyltransferase complex protein AlgI